MLDSFQILTTKVSNIPVILKEKDENVLINEPLFYHIVKYPNLRWSDLYKFILQGTCGWTHLNKIGNEDHLLDYLKKEMIEAEEPLIGEELFEILEKEELAPSVKQMIIGAPLIARKAQAGQFVIIHVNERGERFPLTLVDWATDKGLIKIIFQEVGVSTKILGNLNVGEYIEDIVGPLGNPTEIERYGNIAIIGGGVGTALIYPWVKALKKAGNHITVILGARNSSLLLLEMELKEKSDEMHISTDDGSKGFKGFTADIMKNLLNEGRRFDLAMAAGPVPMMRAIAEATRPYAIRTIVSLNPIMIDGTGMCGGCRVTVRGETKFACVDGPDFDAHKVDFRELTNRLRTYQDEECKALASLNLA